MQNPEKDRQQIEAEIIILEDKLKEMERVFDKSTPAETYEEYDQLLKKVDGLYSRWNELIN